MSYSLNTTILEPMSKSNPKNAVILCHGYGGDGKDISVNAGDKEPATEEKYSISPLQQELELQKADAGKQSKAIEQITTEDEYSNPMTVQDHLATLKKIYKETAEPQEA